MHHPDIAEQVREALLDSGFAPGSNLSLASFIDLADALLTEYTLAYVFDCRRWGGDPRTLLDNCAALAAHCGVLLDVPNDKAQLHALEAAIMEDQKISAVVDAKIKRAQLTT